MNEPVTITLQGTPVGKARARAFLRHGRISHYLPDTSRNYEDSVRIAAFREMRGKQPFSVPVEIILRCVFAPPQSWSERKKAAAITGDIAHTSKPDIDNIAKSWLDALNRIAFADDRLVVKVTAEKRFGPASLAVCTVKPAEAA